MSKEFRIWIDDERKPLPGYNVWVRNDFDHFKDYIDKTTDRIVELSFDHDLGHSLNGLQLITMIEEMVFNDVKFPKLNGIYIHTANGAARQPMLHAAKNIARKIETIEMVRVRNYEWELEDMLGIGYEITQEEENIAFAKRLKFRETEFDGTIF